MIVTIGEHFRTAQESKFRNVKPQQVSQENDKVSSTSFLLKGDC